MKRGDISNRGDIIAYDFEDLFNYHPRHRLDNYLFKYTRGLWGTMAPVLSLKRGALFHLNSIAQVANIHWIICPNKKIVTLHSARKLLEHFQVPAQHVTIVETPDELLDYLKDNDIQAMWMTDYELLQYAGRIGRSFLHWTYFNTGL